MTILVTGASGQLGLDLLDALQDREVVGLDRAQLDVGDHEAVRAALAVHRPNVVVNAAAYTAVDACEDDVETAHRVNALGPWWLARGCAQLGARMVHVSTDYVFDGERPADGRGWGEFDPIDPVNAYGRTKAAGEQLVRHALDDHVVVRTAWLAGARGGNFVRTMLRLADTPGDQPRTLRVVDDQVGSPTFTRDLAAAIVELVDSDLTGTFHRAGRGACSWHELAGEVFRLAGRDVDLHAVASSEYPTRARRPAWSVLADTHATACELAPLPAWRDGLRALLDELGELTPARHRTEAPA